MFLLLSVEHIEIIPAFLSDGISQILGKQNFSVILSTIIKTLSGLKDLT